MTTTFTKHVTRRNIRRAALIATVSLFAYFVWPTQWESHSAWGLTSECLCEDESTRALGSTVLNRTHRITGSAQRRFIGVRVGEGLVDTGWIDVPMPESR